MSKLYVALTGGIGSGKSLAAQFLHEMNYPVFSCDELYKEVVQSDEYIQKLKSVFPTAVQDGKVERKILGEIVFNDEERLKQLNTLAHPLIMDLLMQKMKACDGNLVFAEVPLLFEGNFENLFDRVIYIARDRTQRAQAVLQRDGLSVEDIEKRIQRQFDGDTIVGQERLKKCNAIIIYNNGDKEGLKDKILETLRVL
jgi:dephospho-CoA kinase